MQALPPPPPAVQCVEAEKATSSTYIVISGNPGQLEAVLADLKLPRKVEAKAAQNGIAFARLNGPVSVPYRDIGGLIYSIQRRQLSVSFFVDPPICGMEDL